MIKANTKKKEFGRTTVLTLNVLYTSSVVTFLFSLFCFLFLEIDGVLFYTLFFYAFTNLLNALLFFKHKKILLTYVIASTIAYIALLTLGAFSGGVSSAATSFLVLLIFFGYLFSKFYGNLWLAIVTLTIVMFYIMGIYNLNMINNLDDTNTLEFNLIFLLFLILLLGGVFGRLMYSANEKVKISKIEINKKNNEKAVMLKEIHHRVKNNLQVVNSLLRMQSREAADDNVKKMFQLAQNRVVVMARLHEKIYKSNDLQHIDVNEYFKILIKDLITAHDLENQVISKLTIQPMKMSIDTLLPLSLIINEMVSNSLKHAFHNVEKGEVVLDLKSNDDLQYQLTIGDNGNDFNHKELKEFTKTPGGVLIKTFVRQLNGSFEILKNDSLNTYRIKFSEV